MMVKKPFSSLFACVVPLALGASAYGATVAEYTFDTDAQGWAGRNATTVAGGVVDANFGSSPVLDLNNTAGGGNTSRAFVGFDAVTLAAEGDYVQLDFDVRFTDAFSSVDRRFDVALYDLAAGEGYFGRFSLSTSGSGSPAGQIFDISALSTTAVLSASTVASLGATGDNVVLGNSNSYVHAVTLLITRTATGVDISFTGVDQGGVSRTLTASDNTDAYFVFDTIDMATWGNTLNFNIDNVVVTSNIPEPGSLALIALGGLTMLRRRR